MRCAVLGGDLQGLSLAIRLAGLKHDVWLVANSAACAERWRQELGDQLLCTINESYAVKRSDVLFFVNRSASTSLDPQLLVEWLQPIVAEQALIVIAADVQPGMTSMMRQKLNQCKRFSGAVVYVPPALLHRPYPLVIGTEHGDRCIALEQVLDGWPRLHYRMKDQVAEYVQCFAERRPSTSSSSFRNSKEAREAYAWWHQIQSRTMLNGLERIREAEWS
ncbi:hypothetical protein [Paenibacillus agilis]|uniref:Pyrroline-5-carboxylate reductase catalytic N-terminal domain-containing protein n=1 Tax=Paenibacillus agilis TaxID=3020863 RepID=A0A559IVZ2_9BACL|nr:hypothetical protein [Paenibacillus agilis]TVX91808.1 hypothetical protein FPZ44_01275 [Paenibacillus agilis]